MDRDDSIVAVVPTYRPTSTVLEVLSAIRPQVDHVLVSDDGSPCTSDEVLRRAGEVLDVQVVRHAGNAGIARALNDGLTMATRHQAHWLLTLDQDTFVPTDYTEPLLAEARRRLDAGLRLGAIGAEFIRDGESTLSYPADMTHAYPSTEELIQSGTLWRVHALIDCGGFDESLGIDAVDASACLALRERGYHVGVARGFVLEHQIGNSTSVNIGHRSIMVTGHSPERRTTMLRNRLRLFPDEFRQSPRHAMRTLRRVIVNQSLGLVIEPNRWANAKSSVRALLPHRPR